LINRFQNYPKELEKVKTKNYIAELLTQKLNLKIGNLRINGILINNEMATKN